jgi:hypothetical protein
VDISEAVRSMVVNVRRSAFAVRRLWCFALVKNSRQAAALGRGLSVPMKISATLFLNIQFGQIIHNIDPLLSILSHKVY